MSEIIQSYSTEAVTVPDELGEKYQAIRREVDNETGEARFYALQELPVSEAEYLQAYGISEQDLEARAAETELHERQSAELKAMIESIVEERLAEMTTRIEELETVNQALRIRNQELEDLVKDLTRELEAERSKKSNPNPTTPDSETSVTQPETAEIHDDQPEPEELEGFRRGDKVSVNGEPGEYEVVGFVISKGNKDKLTLKNISTGEGGILAVPEGVTKLETNSGNRVQRASTAVGGWLVGRQVRLHNGIYSLTDRRGQPVREIDQETAEIYTETNERAGTATGVVAVGAAVVGIALWELFEHKVFGHSNGPKTINHYQTVTVPGSGSHTETASAFSVPGPNSSGRHPDFYNSSLQNRKTGIDLPKKLHLKGSTGSQFLADSNGKVIIPHSELSWDRQGNLSRATRAYLKAKNFALTQGNLGKRFMTYIWQR